MKIQDRIKNIVKLDNDKLNSYIIGTEIGVGLLYDMKYTNPKIGDIITIQLSKHECLKIKSIDLNNINQFYKTDEELDLEHNPKCSICRLYKIKKSNDNLKKFYNMINDIKINE